MKKVIALLMIATLIGACKKTDNAELTTEEKIIGIWLGIESYYEETEPGQPKYMESEDISMYNFNFKADGTLIMDSAGYNPETFTWSITNDGKLLWGYGNSSFDVMDIAKLTNTELHLDQSGTYTNNDGDEVPYLESIRLKK